MLSILNNIIDCQKKFEQEKKISQPEWAIILRNNLRL